MTSALASKHTTTPAASATPLAEAGQILSTLHQTATHSASLIGSSVALQVAGQGYQVPKFLLLGQRSGGVPIRLALFAGVDAGSVETTAALARLLLQYELNPSLARDYALFVYPLTNPAGFAGLEVEGADFVRRFANRTQDDDTRYFRAELQEWRYNGIISLRVDANADALYAKVRRKVIGEEVVAPALRADGLTLPLAAQPVQVQAEGRFALHLPEADDQGRAGRRSPQPFEIELYAPGRQNVEARTLALFLVVQEIMRRYRRLMAHAVNL